MTLKLVLVSQAKCDATELFLSEGSYGVGRKHNNELRIQEYCVSGYHAELNRTPEGDYEIKDLDSSNGTFVNRTRISSPVKIKSGDFLKFGIIKMAVEEHQGEIPSPENSPDAEDPPLKIVSLKDRFTKAKKSKEDTAPIQTESVPNTLSEDTATSKLSESALDVQPIKQDDRDKIILFDDEALTEEPQNDFRAQLDELTSARDAAEEEARRLREELSRVREEPSESETDNEKRLSFHITELESSLTAEKLLLDNVKVKNEQFRSKIQFLTTDLDNSREEISRLKAINARQFDHPEVLSTEVEDVAKLREELAISHDDNADLQAELTDLRNELADHEREDLEKEQEGLRTESEMVSQLQAQIVELNSRLSESETQLANLGDNGIDLTETQQELQQQLETAEDAVQKSVEREVTLRQKNTKLVEKLKAAENEVINLTARIEEDSSEDSSNETLIDQLKKQLQEAQSDSAAEGKLHDELKALQQKHLTAEAEAEQLSEKAALLESEAAELKEKLASAEAEAESVRERFDFSEEQRSDIDVLLTAKSDLASEQASTIEQLRGEISESKQDFAASISELENTHRTKFEALQNELQAANDESERLRKDLEKTRTDLTSSQDHNAKEQSQRDHEHESEISKLEEQLAQSDGLRDELERELAESRELRDELEKELAESHERHEELESARDDLQKRLKESEKDYSNLTESSEGLELKIEYLEEKEEQFRTKLQLTREGMSGALHSARNRLMEATGDMESEILRRVKVENQLRKAQAALEDLREEIEALRDGSDEDLVLSANDSGLNRISELVDERSDEEKAFEARLEALCPTGSKENGSNGDRNFNEQEFYLQLIERIDLFDTFIQRYENKWRYSKVVQQLALLKHAFVELLEDHSVSQFDLKPGTPLCLNQSNRIDLVPKEDGTQPKIKPFGKSEVVETVAPGYIYQNGSGDVVIRKARVVVN